MKKILVLLSLCLLGGCVEGINQKDDRSGPYINLNQYEFTTQVGEEIDFSNVTAYDDVDGLIPVVVRGNVNYDKPGEYYLTLTAVDYSNNQTDVGIVVNVVEKEYVKEEIKEPEVIESFGCPNGKNPAVGCDIVLHNDVKDYDTLYYGKDGKERCESREGGKCEVIYTNDHTFWGYGFIKNID